MKTTRSFKNSPNILRTHEKFPNYHVVVSHRFSVEDINSFISSHTDNLSAITIGGYMLSKTIFHNNNVLSIKIDDDQDR